MKPQHLTIGACAVALVLTAPTLPAVAAGVSPAQRTACEKAAEQVRPALRADEKEGWIANCLADATAGSPPKKDRGY
jgi:hypothetical protein